MEIKDRIVNIHLRGELENSRWVVRNSTFEFYETLNMIRELELQRNTNDGTEWT